MVHRWRRELNSRFRAIRAATRSCSHRRGRWVTYRISQKPGQRVLCSSHVFYVGRIACCVPNMRHGNTVNVCIVAFLSASSSFITENIFILQLNNTFIQPIFIPLELLNSYRLYVVGHISRSMTCPPPPSHQIPELSLTTYRIILLLIWQFWGS